MAISGDGNNVYVASAVSNALGVFTRNPSTGALTQATDGTGCIVNSPLSGCTTGTQLSGANAVAVSSDDDNVYVTSLVSNSLTTFNRAASTGQLTQQTGTSACVIYVLAVGCSLGRAFSAPEGSPSRPTAPACTRPRSSRARWMSSTATPTPVPLSRNRGAVAASPGAPPPTVLEGGP